MTKMNLGIEAMLLIGPTGSGKTPLGNLLMQRGLPPERRCLHFDFGENLRLVASQRNLDDLVSQGDADFIRHVLETGVLLEDKDFPIAERILRGFLRRQNADQDAIVVLNGLPRHRGQAEAVAAILEVQHVVLLRCDPETVVQRIQRNAGGDRTHRTDDDLAAVKKKLDVYSMRTEPLAEFYRQQGAAMIKLDVAADMTPATMWEELASHFR